MNICWMERNSSYYSILLKVLTNSHCDSIFLWLFLILLDVSILCMYTSGANSTEILIIRPHATITLILSDFSNSAINGYNSMFMNSIIYRILTLLNIRQTLHQSICWSSNSRFYPFIVQHYLRSLGRNNVYDTLWSLLFNVAISRCTYLGQIKNKVMYFYNNICFIFV